MKSCVSAAAMTLALVLAPIAQAQETPAGASGAETSSGQRGSASGGGLRGSGEGAANTSTQAAETATSTGPTPAAATPDVPPPRDVAYPGVIGLSVDATDVVRHIYRVHETVPVAAAGPMTLLYPQWLPGEHSPGGPLDLLAGLVIHGGGARIEWVRDPVNVFAFHLVAPPGVTRLELDFQYLSPVDQREGRIEVTPDMLDLKWNTVSLYPAGYYSRDVTVHPSLKLPAGWGFGTALVPAATTGGVVDFKPATYNNLVDSPLFAGRYFKRLDLDPGAATPVHLDLVADRPELLTVTPDQLEAHRALVRQAYKLYGSHHYDHYDFLLALSDKLGGEGLEHHQSSENGSTPKYFTDWDKTFPERDLLAHEYTHSWNGKFRRPADLWTPSFNVPMRDSLLWVYEGQTQYWGYVLAARSGLMTKQQTLDAIAETAAVYDHHVGRAWRALEDTTNDPIIANRRPIPWVIWQRSEDYYSEGQLNWLDIDTMIRKASGGRRSLDDFARGFFGIDNGSYVTVTYTFDDVVRALNTVQPYDWASLLRTRLDGHAAGAPLDGLTRGGYRLVYTDKPSDFVTQVDMLRKGTDFSFSLGLQVGKEGRLTTVQWDGPAFRAGLTAGTEIVAVDGEAYDPDVLKDAVKAAEGTSGPITLLVKDNDAFRTVAIDYHDGLRYPHLERIAGTPALLDEILSPRK